MTSSQSNDFFLLHRIIRFISGNAASSFFTEVRVIGGEHVPATGPLIVAATHHNMMLDPAILSLGFPHKRILNYWSKATLFANPIARWVLLSSGNIPVDRKSKDRRVLFKGTFEALSKGQAVALFPEGTSYTEPRIMQVKDGAAWAALEYTKWVDEQRKLGKGDGLQDVLLVPAAIVYTNKSKYRSSVSRDLFGRPISMDSYKAQFLSNVEGAPRAAVKQLTRTLESELVEATINAPNWDTLYVARMARDILWEGNKSIDLEEFVNISQTLVDLFSTPDATPNIISVKRHLLEYYSLLQSTNLTNSVLSSLPLPRLLDPNTSTPLPSRLYTLVIFVSDTVSSLARLPFFVFPLIVHLPVYIMGRFGARLVEDEEETQAQNKVVFGLLSMFMIYPAAFFFLWALFWYTPVGALLAALTCYLFAIYHNRMIDGNAKRFIAAWRILIGVWAPKKWDLSMPALSQYTTPLIPKENPWIDKKKSDPSNTSSPASSSNPNIPSILPPLPEISLPKEREPVLSPRRRPPTRRIMRHVLRARLEAIKALGSFFDQLQRAGDREKLKVKASRHLARTYGGMNEYPGWSSSNSNGNNDAEIPEAEQECWRYATEVITFLKKRGAKFPSVGASAARTTEEEWALLSSDGEGSSTPLEERGEIEWVTPKTQK
ncbi:glycerol-3-phosphate o-acyltransferase [Moniliophthora roreri]|nr:glycerol-3-phosphate o-acyltransferase [Moniliophthora roreri]